MMLTKFLIGMATLLVLAGCSKSPIDKFRDQFVAGCESNGGRGAVCTCVFNEFEKVYSEKDLTMMSKMQRMPVDFPEQLVKAGMTCKNK